MNQKVSKIVALAAFTSFSASAFAFNLKTAPKVEINNGMPTANLPATMPKTGTLKVEPKLGTKTIDIEVPAQSLKISSGSLAAAGAAKTKAPLNSCGPEILLAASEGTDATPAEVAELMAEGDLNIYNFGCDRNNPEAFVNYKAPPRQIAISTGRILKIKNFKTVQGLKNRVAIGAPALASAKRDHGDTTATAENQEVPFEHLMTSCNVFPLNATAQ